MLCLEPGQFVRAIPDFKTNDVWNLANPLNAYKEDSVKNEVFEPIEESVPLK